MPLEQPAEFWAQKALDMAKTDRTDTKNIFIENKYDIESVAKEFVCLVFGEDNN